jgi:hypothetical protein
VCLVKKVITDLILNSLQIKRIALKALQEATKAILTVKFLCKLFLNSYYTNLYTNLI